MRARARGARIDTLNSLKHPLCYLLSFKYFITCNDVAGLRYEKENTLLLYYSKTRPKSLRI